MCGTVMYRKRCNNFLSTNLPDIDVRLLWLRSSIWTHKSRSTNPIRVKFNPEKWMHNCGLK